MAVAANEAFMRPSTRETDMQLLSATCLAIAAADRSGTLRLVERVGRLGPCIALEDDHGVIEVTLTRGEADQRLADIRRRIAR
ncbi:MAG: hypothetical protein AB7I59_20885 [Geminicoccaceae bacterium]